MQVISFNANGIRASKRRGFFEWMLANMPDIVCLQELKAQAADLVDFELPGYYFYYVTAKKKGYSGVGIYTKFKPNNVVDKLGWEIADIEGRYIQLDFNKFSVVSLYLPSGTSGALRQQIKYDFMDFYYDNSLSKLALGTVPYIICGDWNIAHQNIDLKNWRANQKNSGFLPAERSWLDKCFNNLQLVDTFRVTHPDKIAYTWWTYRGKSRINNVGWRIDYQIVTANLRDLILDVAVYNEQVFSDHAPLIVNYNLSFE